MVSYLFCCFLLQLLFGAVLTGTNINQFSGTSFELFSNLTFHPRISLYKNGNEPSVIIALWEMKSATITREWKKEEYMTKIFFIVDITPFILICKVDQTDSGKYIVVYDIDTPGPEVELKIIENKQLDVCLNSPPNLPENYFGKLTEEQVVQYIKKFLDDHPQYIKRHFGNLTEDEFQKWLDNYPGFMKKYFGNLTGEQIGQEVRKWLADHPEYIKEYLGNLTEKQIGQIRKLQDDHTEHMKEYLDGWNPLLLGLLIVMCIIGITGMIILLCILLTKRNQIREGLINMKDWIEKKFCSQNMPENASQNKETLIDIEEPVLSNEDQVHKWLNDHPDFLDKYLGKLTEDQIWKQIQKWDDAYPGLLKNKYLDAHENDQVVTPTLEELSVTLTQHSGTGIEGNPNQSVSAQVMFHASQHSDGDGSNNQAAPATSVEPPVTLTESGNEIEGNQMPMSTRKTFASQSSDEDVSNNQAVITTLVEPPVTLTESGNEIEGNQIPMSTRKTFTSQSSDEFVTYDTATKPTLNELGVTLCGPGSGTEDNQGQLDSSPDDDIFITYSSLNSGTFSEPVHSGNQPFNNDEQDANPEQNMAPDVREPIGVSDSEDECKEPLLKGSC